MPQALTPTPKRIFIIGPMGKGKDRRKLLLSNHIPNIARATRRTLEKLKVKLGDAMPTCEVILPPETPGGSIPHAVFSHIMHCDFAIADISTGSPNVMYELAMLHANGVPVILLGRQIFYLNQTTCIQIRDFSVDSVADALSGMSFVEDEGKGPLERLVTSPVDRKSLNPITQHFGGVDMVNVAAATGAATGQFYNFLQYVIKDGGIFQARPEIKDIVLIKPERIKDVSRVVGLLEMRFREPKIDDDGKEVLRKDGSKVLAVPEVEQIDESHPRGKYFVRRVGCHLVDYPTPISSLAVSKQYIDYGNFLRDYSDGFDDDKLPPFEKKLISIYFRTLENLSNSPANSCDWGRVKVLPIEQALEHLST
jgi:hypothetical protein